MFMERPEEFGGHYYHGRGIAETVVFMIKLGDDSDGNPLSSSA